MNRVDRIVELIDHALDDYGASGDAMRWTPEPVANGAPWTELIWEGAISDGVWLTVRPIPPAESVTIDLSVWD